MGAYSEISAAGKRPPATCGRRATAAVWPTGGPQQPPRFCQTQGARPQTSDVTATLSTADRPYRADPILFHPAILHTVTPPSRPRHLNTPGASLSTTTMEADPTNGGVVSPSLRGALVPATEGSSIRAGAAAAGMPDTPSVVIIVFSSYLLWGFFLLGNRMSSEYVKNYFAAVRHDGLCRVLPLWLTPGVLRGRAVHCDLPI